MIKSRNIITVGDSCATIDPMAKNYNRLKNYTWIGLDWILLRKLVLLQHLPVRNIFCLRTWADAAGCLT